MNYRSSKLYKQNRSLNSKFSKVDVFLLCQIEPMASKDQIKLKQEIRTLNTSLHYISNQSIKLLPVFSEIQNTSFYNLFQGNVVVFSMQSQNNFKKLQSLHKLLESKKINIIGVLINERLICPTYLKEITKSSLHKTQETLVNLVSNSTALTLYKQIRSEHQKLVQTIENPLYNITTLLNTLYIKKQYEESV